MHISQRHVYAWQDNGGDSGDSSNFPLRGRKRSFYEGGVRAASFLASPLLPASRRGRRESAFLHISDWYLSVKCFS